MSSRRPLAVERWLVRRMLDALGRPPIELILWDGQSVSVVSSSPVARVVIHDRPTLWRLVADPDLHFGDAYAAGHLDVEGDLVEFLEAVYRASWNGGKEPGRFYRAWTTLWRRARVNTLAGSRENIHHHYDIGDDFYRLWLDREMVYTCAYYTAPDARLEEAQRAKMDLVCRKLWLRPGETVVEAGCGWGALALYMARHYGVRVRAFNISRRQIESARRRASEEGLADRIEFIEDDYRNITGRYDAFVSVGMLEHVGTDHYDELGQVIDRCLSPEGRGLIHTIGRDKPGELNAWIEQRIFPGANPPSLGQMTAIFEPRALSVLDIENLRQHYAQTLRHWLERFETVNGQVAAMFDAALVRAWRLYLTGSIAAFTTGGLQLFQVLFARHGVNQIPWTRSRLGPLERLPSPACGRGAGGEGAERSVVSLP